MITKSVKGVKRLNVLENFVVDKTLPKFNKEEPDNGGVIRGNFEISNSVFIANTDGSNDPMEIGGQNWNVVGSVEDITTATKKKSKFSLFFANLFNNITKPEPLYTLSVEEFFKSIKNSTEELNSIKGRSNSYTEILNQATKFGQTALAEKIKHNITILKEESQLYAMGLRTVIKEDKIIQFALDAERGVRLDYVKNFTRVIPPSILEIKEKLDDKGIFDNYVVMHYDPDGHATEMTEEEIEKAKDPILFGLIKNSNKLYYISDWIDDYCNLTLSTLLEVIGESGVNEERLSVNIKIENL